ncbi:MAG TPA: aminotransferase class I/II-fold pyridoxal phosphate-dependent enzyme [Streptosporangiaceae bacterium]
MNLHPETRAVHPPVPHPAGSRPLGVPIYQSHTFAFDGADELAAAFDGPDAAYFYSRHGNPTVRALEDAVAGLEGGVAGLAFASGMGAVSASVRGLVRSGDHVIAQRCLYGGTYSTMRDLAERWGVEVTFVAGDDPAEVRAAVRPDTRLLYLETIANPTTQVSDLPALIAAAARPGLVTVVDNTFATPLLCRPLEHGADVVVHSATKFLGGHSDLLGGVAVFRSPDVRRRVWDQAVELGASLDPFAAWLALRGLQTLPLRLERQCANARYLAERLAEHPAVSRVAYPSLPSHPGHEIARRLLAGGAGGAVLAFDLAGGREAGRTFVEAVRLCALTGSLGSVHTLILHPASTTHRQLDAAALAAAGIGEGTIRLAVGIEHRDDLWDDLDQALTKIA